MLPTERLAMLHVPGVPWLQFPVTGNVNTVAEEVAVVSIVFLHGEQERFTTQFQQLYASYLAASNSKL
jgi:hypothetical protein